ncbi:MAG: hypothetical protein JO093_18970 [Acidobacteria bacterium]|nr:hypothetical protein [Acidobacteriota bacterium]MBV9071683.1 hypothetical protein [Acidobacteriota bacterium]MBV9187706.1 hypothetical protein [Acidobacteriota bacterium]
MFLLLAISATNVAAQYTYIVPVSGVASGFNSQYFTSVIAFNPTLAPVTLRYEAIYPAPGTTNCRLPSSLTVLPRGLVGLGPACFGLHALVVTSDQPLRVVEEVFATFLVKDATGNTFGRSELEPIEVATDWIAPEREAMIPLVRILTPPDKANIILVNPNDFVLIVRLHVERQELGKVVDSTLQLEPRSFLMTLVPPIPTPIPSGGIPQVFDAIHQITIRANGKFQAGVSNTYGGGTIYRAAVPLQP